MSQYKWGQNYVDIHEQYKSLYNNENSFYDVVFTTQNNTKKIYAHKVFFIKNSYIMSLFKQKNGTETVIVEDINIADILLRYFYEGTFDINLNNLNLQTFRKLIETAHQWNIPVLVPYFTILFSRTPAYLIKQIQDDINMISWIEQYFGEESIKTLHEHIVKIFKENLNKNDTDPVFVILYINKHYKHYMTTVEDKLIRDLGKYIEKNKYTDNLISIIKFPDQYFPTYKYYSNIFSSYLENYIKSNMSLITQDIINTPYFKSIDKKLLCELYIKFNMYDKLCEITDPNVTKYIPEYVKKYYNAESSIFTPEQITILTTENIIIVLKNLYGYDSVYIESFVPFVAQKYIYLGIILQVEDENSFYRSFYLTPKKPINKADKLFITGIKLCDYDIEAITHIDGDNKILVDETNTNDTYMITLKECDRDIKLACVYKKN